MNDKLGTVEIIDTCSTKIWIEDDIFGNKYIMLQRKEENEPYQFCTLLYDKCYTCKTGILDAAKKIALSLGAKEPIEYKYRPLDWSGQDKE